MNLSDSLGFCCFLTGDSFLVCSFWFILGFYDNLNFLLFVSLLT